MKPSTKKLGQVSKLATNNHRLETDNQNNRIFERARVVLLLGWLTPAPPAIFFLQADATDALLESRSNLYTRDCQKRGKHTACGGGEIELKSNGRRINESTNRCIRNAITNIKRGNAFRAHKFAGGVRACVFSVSNIHYWRAKRMKRERGWGCSKEMGRPGV